MNRDHRAVLRAVAERGTTRGAARVWADASLMPYALEDPPRPHRTRRTLVVAAAGLGVLGGGTAVVVAAAHDSDPATSTTGCVAFFERGTDPAVIDASASMLADAIGSRSVIVFGPEQAHVELERLFGEEIAAAVEPERVEPSVRVLTGIDHMVDEAFLAAVERLPSVVHAECDVALDAAGFRTDPVAVDHADGGATTATGDGPTRPTTGRR